MPAQKSVRGIFGCMLLFLILSLNANAQEEIPMPGMDSIGDTEQANTEFRLKVRGYVEDTFNYEQSKSQSRELLLNSTRARLNLSGSPDKSFDFDIGIVGTLNSGATEFDLADYMPQKTVPEAAWIFKQTIENQIFLQEAFGTLYMPGFRIRIGRHKSYTGTGYAYNPIDIFNYKNPLDPTYEINGLDSVQGTLELPHQTEIQGFMKFGDRLSESGYMLRLKTYFSGWDMALQYSENTKERVDWETLNTTESAADLVQGTPFENYVRRLRWRLLGGEFSGELGGLGIYGEGGYAFVKTRGDSGTLTHAEKDHPRLLLGMDYTFDFQLYFIAEYLHIGQGRTDSSEITLSDRMAYFSGEILSTNRDTAFTGLTYPLTDLLDFSLYGILACNDPSAIINPWLLYNIRPGIKLSFALYVPVGTEQSQNGKAGPSTLVRMKFSF